MPPLREETGIAKHPGRANPRLPLMRKILRCPARSPPPDRGMAYLLWDHFAARHCIRRGPLRDDYHPYSTDYPDGNIPLRLFHPKKMVHADKHCLKYHWHSLGNAVFRLMGGSG